MPSRPQQVRRKRVGRVDSELQQQARSITASAGETARFVVGVIGQSEWPSGGSFYDNDSVLVVTDSGFTVFKPEKKGMMGKRVELRRLAGFRFAEMTHLRAASDDDGTPKVIRFHHDPQEVFFLDVWQDPQWDAMVSHWAERTVGPVPTPPSTEAAPTRSRVDEQIDAILEGLYPGKWGRSLATYANVDGVGLAIGNVLGDRDDIRFAVYIATGVPFSRELVDEISSLNTQVHFGALNIVGSGDEVGLILYYDIMRSWLDATRDNDVGVAQPLLDIVGNLPRMGAELSERVTAAFGGKRPDLSEGWEAAAMMLI